MFKYRKVLKFVNRAVYIMSAVMMMVGLVLTVTPQPASADPAEKVYVCHASVEDGIINYVTLEISENAVYGGHFNEDGSQKESHELDYLGPCATDVPVGETPLPTIAPDGLYITLQNPYCVAVPGELMQWAVVNNNAEPFLVESWSIDGVMQAGGFVAPVGVSLLTQTSLGEHTIVLNWEQEGSTSLEYTIESCALPEATLIPTNTVVPVEGTPENKVTICHAAGLDGTLQYVTLNIGWNAVYGPGGHFNLVGSPKAGHENDYLGACATVIPTTVPVEATPVPDTATPTITPNLLVVTLPDPYCVSMPGNKMQWTVVNNNAEPFNILSWSIDGVMQPYGFTAPVGVTLLAQTDLGEHNIVLNWEQEGSVSLEFTIESCALPNTATPTLTATTVPVEATPEGKVEICHAAGQDDTLHYVTLNIGWSAVYGPGGHFNENGTPKAGHEQDYLGACIVAAPTSTPVPVVNTPMPTITPNLLVVTLPDPYCVSMPGDKMQWTVVNNNAEPFNILSWSIDGVMQPYGFTAPVGVTLLAQTDLGEHTIVLNWEQEGSVTLEYSIETCALPNTATPTLTATTVPVVATPEEKVTICHAAGQDDTLHYVTLTIGWNAVYGPGGHFNENGTPQAGHEQDSLGACATVTPTTVPVVATPVPDTATPTATYTPVNTATLMPTNTPMPTFTPNLLFVTMPEPYCVSLPGNKMQWTVVNNNAQPFNILSWSIDGVAQPYGFTAPVGVTLLAQTDLGTHTIVLNWEQEGSVTLEFTIESCAVPNTATAVPATNTPVYTATLLPTNTPVNTATLIPTSTIVPVANTPVNTATLIPTSTIVPVTNTPVNTATLIPTSTIVPATNTPMPTVTPNLLFVTMPEPYCVSLPGDKMQWTVVNNNAQPFNILSWSIDGVMQPYGFTAPVGVTLLAQTDLGEHNIVLNWEQKGSAYLEFTIESCAEPTATPTNTAVPATSTPVNTATSLPTNTPVNTATALPTNTPVNTATLVPTATLMPTNTLVPVANTPVNTATLIPTSTIVPATNTPMPTVTPNLLFVTMPEPYCVSLPGSKIQWTVVNNNAQPFNILSWSIDGVAQPYGFTAPVGVTLLAQTELGTHNIVLNWEQEGSASLQFTIDSCAAPTALAPANTAVPVTNIATTVPTLSIPKTSGTEIPIIPVTGADLNKSVNGWFFGGFGMLGFGLILSGLRKIFDL